MRDPNSLRNHYRATAQSLSASKRAKRRVICWLIAYAVAVAAAAAVAIAAT